MAFYIGIFPNILLVLGFLLFWRAMDSDEYSEPVPASRLLPDIKWIYTDFEIDVHAFGAGDYR